MNKNKVILSAMMIMIMISAIPLAIGADNSNSAPLVKTTGTNSGKVTSPLKSVTYAAGPESLAPSARILVYADDNFHVAPNTYIDQALRQLGVSYKAFYNGDFNGFNTALTTGGPWDLVIFGQESYALPGVTTLNDLNAYVGGGGRLIARSWELSKFPSNSLWNTMGVLFVNDNTGTPAPVYWWESTHPAIVGKIPQYTTYPNSPPQFTALVIGRLGTYGQYVQPLSGSRSLAGYTQNPFVVNNAAIILRSDDKTLFLGFMDGQNDADYNNNGVMDGIELWKNEISYMLKGPENFVFVRGTDNGLWYRTYGTTWSSWIGLGGTLVSDPDSVTWDGKTYVFVRGTDNGLWYRTFDGLHWSGWTSLGGVITSGPGAS